MAIWSRTTTKQERSDSLHRLFSNNHSHTFMQGLAKEGKKPAYIYALFDARQPDKIRYIGQTPNPDARTRCHFSPSTTRHKAFNQWYQATQEFLRVKILCVVPIEDRRIVERRAIQSYVKAGHPLLNIIY